MKHQLCLYLSALILSSIPASLLAQEYDYHPFLSDNFSASLGAMKSSNSFKMRADALIDPFENDIDFGDSLGVTDSSTFFNGNFKWKFGKKRKWSFN